MMLRRSVFPLFSSFLPRQLYSSPPVSQFSSFSPLFRSAPDLISRPYSIDQPDDDDDDDHAEFFEFDLDHLPPSLTRLVEACHGQPISRYYTKSLPAFKPPVNSPNRFESRPRFLRRTNLVTHPFRRAFIRNILVCALACCFPRFTGTLYDSYALAMRLPFLWPNRLGESVITSFSRPVARFRVVEETEDEDAGVVYGSKGFEISTIGDVFWKSIPLFGQFYRRLPAMSVGVSVAVDRIEAAGLDEAVFPDWKHDEAPKSVRFGREDVVSVVRKRKKVIFTVRLVEKIRAGRWRNRSGFEGVHEIDRDDPDLAHIPSDVLERMTEESEEERGAKYVLHKRSYSILCSSEEEAKLFRRLLFGRRDL